MKSVVSSGENLRVQVKFLLGDLCIKMHKNDYFMHKNNFECNIM